MGECAGVALPLQGHLFFIYAAGCIDHEGQFKVDGRKPLGVRR